MATLHLDSPGAFFPPLQEGDQTPEFIRWAIDYQCEPREQHRGENLESLFRQLRPLAALGDAHFEGRVTANHRVVNSACDATFEFDAAEILSYYGAASLDNVPCLTCPANASTSRFPHCLGILSRGPSLEPFVAALETELAHEPNLIPMTTPRWYGFWAESPLQGNRLLSQVQLLAAASKKLGSRPPPIEALIRALHTAIELNASLHVKLHPPGHIHAGRWLIPAHCGYCGGLRAPRQRVCKICKRDGDWKSNEKRHLIGIRPYRTANARK